MSMRIQDVRFVIKYRKAKPTLYVLRFRTARGTYREYTSTIYSKFSMILGK